MNVTYPFSFTRNDDGVWASSGVEQLAYSDGYMVENRMLKQVREANDVSALSQELRMLAVDWPTRYHFSPRRASLLRPLTIRSGLPILEIGAGCGAITRYLGELGADVVALEGTYRRASIAASRTRDLPNVRVVAGRLDDIEFTDKFELVLLVGVLEYAAMYAQQGGDENPHSRLLQHCLSLLSPSGVLGLAIENRLGIKYIGGAAEDHTGYAYLGVDGGYETNGPRTFDHQELIKLLQQSGFKSIEILTPLPDYKLVRSVVRWSKVPPVARNAMAQFVASSFYEDPQHQRLPPFSLEQMGASLVHNGLALSLGSSFLVLGGPSSATLNNLLPDSAFAWYYAVDRAPEFTKVTVLEQYDNEVRVRREPLCPQMDQPSVGQLRQKLENEQFFQGESVWLSMVSSMNHQGWTVSEAAESLKGWARMLKAAARPHDSIDVVPGEYLDHVPFNTVAEGTNLHVFDLEWYSTDEVPLLWVALRGLLFSLEMITSLAEPAETVPLQTGPLACAIAYELFGRSSGDYNLGKEVSFLEWLASVQATASGRPVETSYSQLVGLWESLVAIRDRPPYVNALELNPHINASESGL